MKIRVFKFISLSALVFLTNSCTSLSKNKAGKTTMIPDFVKTELYDVEEVEVAGTTFTIMGRKSGGFGANRIKKSVSKFWKDLSSLVGVEVKTATVVDFEASLGGGPLGRYVIGVFSSSKISSEHKKLIKRSLGASGFESTQEYIEKYYGIFSDPIQAYVDDMVLHELGHLFFGFGATNASQDKEEWWFPYGMGLVYDRIIWDRHYEQSSPLFDGVIRIWEKQFRNRADVDQRLVSPDTSKDKSLGLERLQTFGHGKSFTYLRELRRQVGLDRFDKVMRDYLNKNRNREISYKTFTSYLPDREQKILSTLEIEFQVK